MSICIYLEEQSKESRWIMKRIRFGTLFLVGLLAGILIMNIGKSVLLEGTGLLDEYTLYHMKYMTVDSNALFYYVLRQRIGGALILGIFATTYLGIVVCAGAAFWYGLSAGAFLAALILRYGLKGILFALVGIFPQYLLYVPAMVALLMWGVQLNRSIYFRGYEGNIGGKYFWIGKALRFVGILFVLVLGCILESFWNPQLMLALLKIF